MVRNDIGIDNVYELGLTLAPMHFETMSGDVNSRMLTIHVHRLFCVDSPHGQYNSIKCFLHRVGIV